MFNLTTKELQSAPFSLIRAIALSLARDIDRGNTELRSDLERVMKFAETAKVMA